jgi:zinc protease
LGNHNLRRTGPSIAKIDQINPVKAYSIYKERFADASDFTFTFIGNFDTVKIKPLLEQWLGSLPSIKRNEQPKDLGIHIPTGLIEKEVYKGSDPKATVRLVFSGEYVYNQNNNIQLEALGQILQIKLTERLREKESGVYSPSARASYVKYPANRYSIIVSFGCAPNNVERLIAATMDEINKIKTNGAEAVDIQKIIAEDTRTKEIQLKENGYWLNYLSNCYENNDNPKSILNYISSLNKVTQQSIKDAANTYLSGNNIVKLVLLPESGK